MTAVSPIQFVDGVLALLQSYDAFIFDQFGVLHNGRDLYPNAAKTISAIADSGKPVLVLTNSGKGEVQNLDRICRLGIRRGDISGVITSGDVTQVVVLPKFISAFGARCYHLAGPNEDTELILSRNPALRIVADLDQTDFVYLSGIPPNLALEWQDSLLPQMIKLGLPLLCSNPDFVAPNGDQLAVGPGTIAARYADLGGVIELVGKPYPAIYQAVTTRLPQINKERMLMIGDSYHHDIVGAHTAGIDSLLLLGGVHHKEFESSSRRDAIEILAQHFIKDGVQPTWASFAI